MKSKIKTIIISVAVVAIIIAAYFMFFKRGDQQPALTSSTSTDLLPSGNVTTSGAPADSEFLSILLSIRGIKLNDGIFSDQAFINLRESNVILVQDGTEGRKNPFAPIGTDPVVIDLSTSDIPNIP